MFDSQESELQSPATCAGCAENKILLQTIREFQNKKTHNLKSENLLYHLYCITYTILQFKNSRTLRIPWLTKRAHGLLWKTY